MKKITCDICKKDIGWVFEKQSMYATTQPTYPMMPFLQIDKPDLIDLCPSCRNRIASAMNKEIEAIKVSL